MIVYFLGLLIRGSEGFIDFNLPLATGDVAQIGSQIGVGTLETLDKLLEKYYFQRVINIFCIWVLVKLALGLRKEFATMMPMKHTVKHSGYPLEGGPSGDKPSGDKPVSA